MPNGTGRGDDRAEICDLLSRFAFLADEGDPADAGALFAPDGVWETRDGAFRGPGEIARVLAGYREKGVAGPGSGTRHVVTNVEVDFDGADSARSRCYWTLVGRGDDGTGRILAFGQYQDVLRRLEHGWRLARRRVVV
ncbi:nuclear transport factor 2 family protein [Actinomadura rifamycini]|uniref:nuclear transport factor 2 family protein n=1 Tax=Actinomadura rifamycini TaxID=31962 RepID=UPI00040B1470|nr:nuclear transport factor 2 family protein [Actinomadura rifamycini]